MKMRFHTLLMSGILAAGVACVTACETDSRKQLIQAEITKYLETFSAATPETQQVWGMSEFRIIGMGAAWASTYAEINPVEGEPNAFAAALQLWCTGKSVSGEPLKLRRTLHLKAVTADNGATWRIENPEFRNDQPLTFGRQLLWWLFGTFVVLPIIFFIGLAMWASQNKVGCVGGLFNWAAPFLVLLAPLALPAYLAYSLFDSVVFTIICLVVSIPITIGIYKALPSA